MDITVAIVTYKDDRNLKSLSLSLSNQTLKAQEILIFDAANSSNTKQLVIATQKSFPQQKIQYIETDKNNLGENRAQAVNICKTPWIAFIDSDALPEKDWLEKMMQAHQQILKKHTNIAGIGAQNLFPQQDDRFFINMHYQSLKKMTGTFVGHFNSPQAKRYKKITEVPHIPTTNVLYKRDFILKVGNFSSFFSRVGEDVDLSLRLRKKGFLLFITPYIQVKHSTDNCFTSWCRRMFRFGFGQIKILEKHSFDQFPLTKTLPLAFIFIMMTSLGLSSKNPLFLIPFGFYVISIFILSFIQTIKERPISFIYQLFYLTFLYLGTHFFYSLGELIGLFQMIPKNCKQKPRSISQNTEL